jgi:hypothetical protein
MFYRGVKRRVNVLMKKSETLGSFIRGEFRLLNLTIELVLLLNHLNIGWQFGNRKVDLSDMNRQFIGCWNEDGKTVINYVGLPPGSDPFMDTDKFFIILNSEVSKKDTEVKELTIEEIKNKLYGDEDVTIKIIDK